MRIWHILGVCLILLGMSSGSTAQINSPSISEIDADLAAKRYQDVVRKSTIALQNRAGLVGEDRRAVLEMKADAHLHLKQFVPATDAFTALAKDAVPESSTAAKYAATARLLKSLTPGGFYQPKSAGTGRSARPAPIPVIEPADRERALLAFYEDDRRALDALIEQLTTRVSLQSLQETIAKAESLRQLETAAIGTDVNSKALLDPIRNRAAALLNEPLVKLKEKVTHLSRLASRDRVISQTINADGVRQDLSQKVGLTAAERTELHGIERNLNTIIVAAEDFANKLGVDLDAAASGSRRGRDESPTLVSVHADAIEQLEMARNVLSAKYVSTPVNSTRGRATRPVENGD